ncbi:RNA-dependent RNA polymerase [Diplocarpon rosae]|nr:RNA-dependent RNA polymerase [Diplocarpon rosae]
MEVFIRDVPEQMTESMIRKLLRPFFDKLSIQTYHCRKQAQKKFAFLTFLHLGDGQNFIMTFGQNKPPQSSPEEPKIRLLGTPVYCSVSKNAVNSHLLRSLAKEEKDRITLSKKPNLKAKPTLQTTKSFTVLSVSCGVWGYRGSELCFIPHFELYGNGNIQIGTRSMILRMNRGQRLDFLYTGTHNYFFLLWLMTDERKGTKSITTEDSPNASITITMYEAPRISNTTPDTNINIAARMSKLKFTGESTNQRRRVTSLDKEHAEIVGCCFVYQVCLFGDSKELRKPLQNLQYSSGIPPIVHQQVPVCPSSSSSFASDQRMLEAALSDPQTVPWKLAYQLRRFAKNGCLSPLKTLQLLPEAKKVMARSGIEVAVAALRKLYADMPYPGLETEASEFDLETMVEYLRKFEEQAKREEVLASVDENDKTSERLAMIHQVRLTPAGLYLSGPDPEPHNRVLRKYPKYHEFFLRVQFADEDGEPVRFNQRISNESVFSGRFKRILRSGFFIAGRKFDFLGFSHSSLRAQSCWFMSPFAQNGSLIYDRVLIQQLGDFTKIRCPAKCAARIGQAFSETPIAVPLKPWLVQTQPDVQRGSRVFSAKGMLSLDNRLVGDQILMRPSMVKFEGSESFDLELCNASYNSLPMYLNRQTIKIMEDLGVADEWFLNLQSQEIERLRKATTNASNAAKFLTSHTIGDRVHLPWLIRNLSHMSIEFRTDRFLCDVLEMSVMMEVKSLKHRARYPVLGGLTLYGIMDETGILEENEIFCTFQTRKGKKTVITKRNVLVTRSPALHPGDIQLAHAVNVPRDSPLMKLSNCICFSQKGNRDLPSKLSGGDLDGDLYNIIWDPECLPTRYYEPADYPRQPTMDIGRRVERDDMTDFFVTFMETDQLGRIATNHQILADQRSAGTLDPDCTRLAEMHSTAVDFSKTGVPVDMKRMPKFTPVRPDFMAMGSIVRMEKKEGLQLEAKALLSQDDDNDDDESPAYRYYESHKILGKLYRAIDEHEVFSEIKKYRMLSTKTPSVLNRIWVHVQKKCWNLQWARHVTWAREMREMYEYNLKNTMAIYSEHPSRPISELEAFIGNILGVTGNQSKKQRDLSVTMKEAYDRDAGFVIKCMLNNDDGERAEDALERSMACLSVCLDEGNAFVTAGRNSDQLVSFGYIAAAVCLREMDMDFE